MYQIDGRETVFEWLRQELDPTQRLIMLEWLAGLAQDPLKGAFRVPAIAAPVYLAVVPLRAPVTVKFLLAEQFRAVKLIKIEPLA